MKGWLWSFIPSKQSLLLINQIYDICIVGAGPIGLETAANARAAGLSTIVIEAGCLGQTIAHWPPDTAFFSSPERCAIAGLPIQNRHQSMLCGEEYLAYLRQVVEIRDIPLKLFSKVRSLHKKDGLFTLQIEGLQAASSIQSRYLVLATGNMNHPRRLGVPGEDKAFVTHRFEGVHRYFRQKVLIVGGRNSAVEAAIRCWRAGSDVTISYRGSQFEKKKLNSRYHLEIGILCGKGKIGFLPQSQVLEIQDDRVILGSPHGRIEHYCDAVLVQIGFDTDLSLMKMAGVKFTGRENIPEINPDTMETNISGLFLAGTASGGGRSSYKIFVATSHHHGASIISNITGEDPPYRGSLPGRAYDFSNEDIAPVEGNADDVSSPAEPL